MVGSCKYSRVHKSSIKICPPPITIKTEKKAISMPSEVTTPTRGTRRFSTGSTVPGSSASHSNANEKILPRYLRASTGSCHDFCKYGRKLASEEEGNQRILRGPPGNKPSINKEYRRPKVLSLGEQMKRPVIKAEPIIRLKADKEGRQVKSLVSGDINKRPIVRSKALPYSKSSTEKPHLELKDVPSKPRKIEEKITVPPVKKATALVWEKSPEKPMASAKAKLVKQMLAEKNTTSSKTQFIKQAASDSHRNVAPDNYVISSNKMMAISSRNSSVQQSQEDKIETSVGVKEIKDNVTISAQYAGDDLLNMEPGKNWDGESDSPVDYQEDIQKVVHDSDCKEEKTLYVVEPEFQNMDQKSPNHQPLSSDKSVEALNSALSESNVSTTENVTESISGDQSTNDEINRWISIATTDQSPAPAAPDEPVGEKSIGNHESSKDDYIGQRTTDNFHGSSRPSSLDSEHSEELESSFHDSASESGEEHISNEDSFEVGEKSIGDHESSKDDCIGQRPTAIFHESSRPSSPDSEHCEELESSFHDSASESGEEIISNEDSFEVEGRPRRTAQPSSFKDLTKESESQLSESIESDSENGSAKSIRNDELSKVEDTRSKRTATLRPEINTLTPHKLKFKRGKVIELPTDSNNGPRRLRFRRRRRLSFSRKGEIVGEHAVGDGRVGKRSYTRQNEMDSGISSDPKLEAPVVVLRHQDTQDKKDPQGLLNSVIEETASKLVEVRKSKVKALVGAFETVISLKDVKPTLKALASTALEEAH